MHFKVFAVGTFALSSLVCFGGPARAGKQEPCLYVSQIDADEVAVVDLASNEVVDQVAVGDAPTGIALSPNGTTLYVVNELSQTVSVIDTSSEGEVTSIFVGSGAYGAMVGSCPTNSSNGGGPHIDLNHYLDRIAQDEKTGLPNTR